ncbi:DUF5682 family protein [Neobacillus massiliamazoniensis]|uniref:4-aminobutyrate aminotransferase n=1 Tax=Neobacillus massiliamazoniensis TaxID=1499688 RepID=A0A0U1NQ99_9BACI|nr:DUF5682 family protein [Neobacillus massiliamazoniensis]CRK80210.1 hypothetical protein BN000_00091 [Neobacillus massiliamazoniensis]
MKPHIFGVRHLSPVAAYHLETLLEQIKPTAVLIEGPSDMSGLIPDITRQKTKPPIAMMAYTTELPINTIVYPLAEYSPEFRSMLWAEQNDSHVEFIDLPSGISILFDRSQEDEDIEKKPINIYERIASLSDESDYETFWERSFEQIFSLDNYRAAMDAFALQLRELEQHTGRSSEWEYNQIRESYMRKQINRIINEGHQPDKVVVITGAFHVPALLADSFPDVDVSALPKRDVSLTLMPYSNFKLSSQSGYGAGNHAPAYFHMMWNCLKDLNREKLTAYYLTNIVSTLRASGTYRSTAEVIEATRLASALASIRNSIPTLKDLRDAATVCLGNGDFSVIVDACTLIEIGTEIGELPDGVSQTSIQEDFIRQLKSLKLVKYRTSEVKPIQLDLRENRRVKSKDAAFLDLHRSFFFHRLQVLGIQFAMPVVYTQEHASWAEIWNVTYNPEVEIQLIESTLLGETIELATAYQLKKELSKCQNIGDAARLVRASYMCGMVEMMEEARNTVAFLSTDSADFVENTHAVDELCRIVLFGNVRGLDTKTLIPLVERLFLRGTLLLLEAASCNNDRAKEVMVGIQVMNETATALYEYVNETLWYGMLTELYQHDDRNPLLSGYSCGILLEKNKIDSRSLEEEVSRCLSPGISPDLGAGWFEGLCLSNKYALLSRTYLWGKLDLYITTLSDEEFRRALVFLRRSFSNFSSSDRSKVAEILGGIWGYDELQVSEYLNDTLTTTEETIIDELNEFDFGDI